MAVKPIEKITKSAMQKWPEKGDNKEKVKEIHEGGGDKVEEVDK